MVQEKLGSLSSLQTSSIKRAKSYISGRVDDEHLIPLIRRSDGQEQSTIIFRMLQLMIEKGNLDSAVRFFRSCTSHFGTDEMFLFASDCMLADVILAFEQVVKFHPDPASREDDAKHRSRQMEFLNLFVPQLSDAQDDKGGVLRKSRIFKVCTSKLPACRRPRLLVLWLATTLHQATALTYLDGLFDICVMDGVAKREVI